MAMRAALIEHSAPDIYVRPGTAADIGALLDLENRVFATGRMSRRSLRHFLASRTAAVAVAEYEGRLAGCAVVLFRPASTVARLYSIAVDPNSGGCGIGSALLDSAEQAALARNCLTMRLEVHERNTRAIARYRKAGYRQFDRHARYYADDGDALRFEKHLTPLA